MTARAVLWVACLLAEVAAFIAAARSGGSSSATSDEVAKEEAADTKSGAEYSKVLHLRDFADYLRNCAILQLGDSRPISATGARWRNLRRFLQPLPLLLAFAVLSDVWIAVARALVFTDELHPVREAVARLGWPARALYHVETALVMGWPAGLAAACLRVFVNDVGRLRIEKRGHRPVDVLAGCYLGAVGALAVAFPLAPGWTAVALKVWEVLCVAFCAGAIVASYQRARRGEAVWTRTHGALLVLATVEAAVVAIGPFAKPNIFEGWIVARAQYAFGMLAVAALLSWPRRSTGPR